MSKLTLDEAIKHCLDIADGQDKCAEISVSEHAKERISQCAADHRQLAEWLTELKEAKRLLKAAIKVINENCDGFCEYCKYYTKFNLSSCELGIDVCENNNQWEWKHEAEALNLIGGSENG